VAARAVHRLVAPGEGEGLRGVPRAVPHRSAPGRLVVAGGAGACAVHAVGVGVAVAVVAAREGDAPVARGVARRRPGVALHAGHCRVRSAQREARSGVVEGLRRSRPVGGAVARAAVGAERGAVRVVVARGAGALKAEEAARPLGDGHPGDDRVALIPGQMTLGAAQPGVRPVEAPAREARVVEAIPRPSGPAHLRSREPPVLGVAVFAGPPSHPGVVALAPAHPGGEALVTLEAAPLGDAVALVMAADALVDSLQSAMSARQRPRAELPERDAAPREQRHREGQGHAAGAGPHKKNPYPRYTATAT
jgi:hypothetical protein